MVAITQGGNHIFSKVTRKDPKIYFVEKIKPACLGTELQQPWPWVVTYLTNFSSSSRDHNPLLTFYLLQQEWCPINPSFKIHTPSGLSEQTNKPEAADNLQKILQLLLSTIIKVVQVPNINEGHVPWALCTLNYIQLLIMISPSFGINSSEKHK